jgi:hypothetical protein
VTELSTPVEVGRATGHHWFSSLHALSATEILCEVVCSADVAQGQWPATLYLSRDRGDTWHHAADIDSYGPASLRLDPTRLLMLPYEQWPLTPGNRRNTRADGTIITYADGTVTAEPTPVRFLDFPEDLDHYNQDELFLLTSGNVLSLADGDLFTTLYGRFGTDTENHHYDCVAVCSDDGGFTWHYRSHVATWRSMPGSPEGPNESNTVRLADGRLMCVYRVGWNRQQHYHRSFSADEGHTWTQPARFDDQWSVLPQVLLLDGGALVLTGGRPGLMMWVDEAGQGDAWTPINLAEHHNRALSNADLHFGAPCVEISGGYLDHTTAYTGLVPIGPDEVLVSYDRLGNGWEGAPGPRGAHDTVFSVRARLPSADL